MIFTTFKKTYCRNSKKLDGKDQKVQRDRNQWAHVVSTHTHAPDTYGSTSVDVRTSALAELLQNILFALVLGGCPKVLF